jgi:hypothetical protein
MASAVSVQFSVFSFQIKPWDTLGEVGCLFRNLNTAKLNTELPPAPKTGIIGRTRQKVMVGETG